MMWKCFPEVLLSLKHEVKWKSSVMFDQGDPMGYISFINSPDQSTGVGEPFPSSGDLPNQWTGNQCPVHCRQILDQLSHKGKPMAGPYLRNPYYLWVMSLYVHYIFLLMVQFCYVTLSYQWWVYIFCDKETCSVWHIEQDLSGLFWCFRHGKTHL